MHPSLLQPFVAHNLPNAAVVFTHGQPLADANLLARFGFGIVGAMHGVEAHEFGDKQKTFFAERYGGNGMRTNGGGVRCGVDGDYLVKGMGCNQLLGEGIDFWYAHGSMPLSEALAEAMWARLLQVALPFGAVDVPAVLASGSCSWFRDKQGERQQVPGGLLIRRAALRLASFERAVYFRPLQPPAKYPKSDVERMRSLIAELPNSLPLPPQLELEGKSELRNASQLSEKQRLQLGLGELVRRYACQSAAAASKRIMHGALVSSNIALDGRWMDLGSVTELPGFGINKVFRPSFWRENQHFFPGIENLLFYIQKYSPATMRLPEDGLPHLKQLHSNVFQYELLLGLLGRAGFPVALISQLMGHDAVLTLANLLLGIAQAGTTIDRPRGAEQLEEIGDYRFGSIVKILAFHSAKENDAQYLLPLIQHPKLAYDLHCRYRQVAQLLRQQVFDGAMTARNFARLCGLNALKSDTRIALFRRTLLDQHLQQLVLEYRAPEDLRTVCQQLSEDLFTQASLIWKNSLTNTTLVWQDSRSTIEFDALTGDWVKTLAGMKRNYPWQIIWQDNADFPSQAIRKFWGENHLRELF